MRIAWIALLLFALTAWSFADGLVTQIEVKGNKNVSREAILAAMQTKVGQTFSQSELDQDQSRLEELGFFKAVNARSEPAGNDWKVLIDVEEFPMIREIRVVGNTVVSTDDINKVLSFKSGELFNIRNVKPSADAIRKLYQDRGYYVSIKDLGPLENTETLNIELVETHIKSVSVEGNNRTKDYVMRRLIKSRPGDVFSIRQWQKDMQRVANTQWFESVKWRETNQEEVGQIDLIMDVVETRTGQLGLGVQVDPRSNFAGFIRVSDSNFRGSGQTLSANFLQSTSGDGPSIDLGYANPFLDNRDTTMNFSVYSKLIYRFTGTSFGGDDTPTQDNRYTERRTGASLGFSRPVAANTNAYISTRFENITTANLDTTLSTNFIQQDGNVAIMTLGATRNRRDFDRDASRGDWIRLQLEPGYSNITQVGGLTGNSSILGSNYFVKGDLEYRNYWSDQPPRKEFDEPRRVLAFRAKLSKISGEVPFFEQYFVGGSETIRGYQEDRFWGTTSLLTNLEYRYPIQKSFNLIAFVDYGGAWGGYDTVNDFTQSNSINMHLGYGLGFSFRSPLGPIRVDFGINEDGGSRTHFKIGSSF